MKFRLILIIRLVAIVLLSVLTGVLMASGCYWAAAAIILVLIRYFVNILQWVTRSIKDMKRLIAAIRFAELNISLHPAIKKGLPEELAQEMENSLIQFRNRLMKTEADNMFYDILLQRIDSGILVLNKHGNIEWINKTAIYTFGKPQPRQLSDLEDVSPGLPAMLEQLLPREAKVLTINKSGIPSRFAVTATVLNTGGKELKLINLKNIQSALEEHESDAWRKLIRVLTHEMMNSITPIISLAETLSEETAEDKEKRYATMSRAMQTIHRRSKGLVDFVKNYQQLTRIPDPILGSISAEDMLADIHHLLEADGINFKSMVNPPDIQLVADRTLIEQVLINLLKNAWEACRDMSQPEVSVDIRKNEYQRPIITISDNGCGIIPDVMDKVFVPFFTTKTGGSGIGLSICRQIMNLHQGSITVESQVDEGTKVTLRF